MNYVKIHLVSWNRFITRNFAVVPELLGLACKFPLEDALISVELPTADNLKDNSEDSKLKLVSYKEENGHKVPLKIAVNSVDVTVNLNKKRTLPEEILTRHPNAIDLLSEKQQQNLNELAEAHNKVASMAFDLWVKILRWKSCNGSICRPEVHGAKSGWGTYLLNNATKQRLWIGSQMLTLRMFGTVTKTQWEEAEKALKLGQTSPIYIDSMYDGMEQFSLGNFQRTVVDLAVACEAFMHLKIANSLPSGLTEAVARYIDEANIRQVLEHLYKDTLSGKQSKLLNNINSTLHQLFDARNTILHSGHKEDLTSDNCQKYIEATQKLIQIG